MKDGAFHLTVRLGETDAAIIFGAFGGPGMVGVHSHGPIIVQLVEFPPAQDQH